jgi:hypothetical protein
MPILRIIVFMFGLLFIIIHATRLPTKLPFRHHAVGPTFTKSSEVYQIPLADGNTKIFKMGGAGVDERRET